VPMAIEVNSRRCRAVSMVRWRWKGHLTQ
jgi:hypothetical protein